MERWLLLRPVTLGDTGSHVKLSSLDITIVGESWACRGFFAAGGQTQWFSQFKVDSMCLPMFPHCGSFGIGPRRPLPYAKLSGTNPEIGTCRGNFSVWQPNDRDRAPPVQGYGQRNSWLVESMKKLSRRQSWGINLRDCQLVAWLLGALQVLCWLKSFHGKCLSPG